MTVQAEVIQGASVTGEFTPVIIGIKIETENDLRELCARLNMGRRSVAEAYGAHHYDLTEENMGDTHLLWHELRNEWRRYQDAS